jgi:FkbM family methyltransferase
MVFLISEIDIMNALNSRNIKFTGALHVGAHDCEELITYQTLFGIPPRHMIWIDALQDKVNQAHARRIPNVYCAVITDKDGDTITFKRTNNDQSSSVLDLGTHTRHHPQVVVTGVTKHQTITIDTFMKLANKNPALYNFWNFDIQGAELLALKGAEESIKYAKALYLEVNTEEVYQGCALVGDLDTYLGERGFERVLTKMWDNGSCGWGDALYVRTRQ